ncbi:cytochrome c3-like protein [Breoghania corrubedonensis]|uniref:Cytochrome c3-like protein n=1 Tax=Breoghania corrubedonensis TaxID=665038 RepID=A0A2T5VF64_9HYPH|nr:cytochrome c3 family protein [Breoghania corrubedonensis]PTW62394.1 cytochrome c3-like protein [Breoghania corrubedonensis]
MLLATLRAALTVLVFLAIAPASAAEDPVAALAAANDVLADWDIPVTSGAAAGYVPDKTCALCHEAKAESFQHVAMGKSFYRPLARPVIEDFSKGYHHVPSDRYYEMALDDGAYIFRRYKLAPDGTRIDVFERKVDWILGSGNHVRVYLYQTADGALYQLPLAWYTQDGGHWAMAPGFEFKLHLGVGRQVRRSCMTCHNAYPDVAEGSDALHMPEVYPKDLPQGIGCQRCHGPGADHVRHAMSGADEAVTRAAIVNPGKLGREKLYSVCYGCHMQPTVAVTGIRRFGRGAYSFRPGEDLDAYRTGLDIVDPGMPKGERFEINHHPYRLEQSRCFIESGGKLGCLTCHDPHVKRTPAERPAHYRAACLTCHGVDTAGLPLATSAPAGTASTHPQIADDADCTTCHMPARRTQDVIEVTMTDHLIVRDPGPADLTARIDKRVTEVAGVEMLDPHAAIPADEALAARAMAVLDYSGGKAGYAADALATLFARAPSRHFEPWYALAESLFRRADFKGALDPLAQAILRAPGHPRLRAMEAVSLYGVGRKALGLQRMEALLAGRTDLPLARYQLAVMYRSEGRMDDAIAAAHKALAARFNLWMAWRLIGEVELERGNAGPAADAFKAALAIEPDAERVSEGLVSALMRLGREREARLYRATP